jgi:hypothetical protein
MMHVPLTLALLATLAAIFILLRIRWPLLSPRLRTMLIALAFAAILLNIFMHVTKWSPNSDRIYRLIGWATAAAYLFLLILWTRKSPRWLTTLSAAILLVPVLSPSFLFPLSEIFNKPPLDASLADSLLVERTRWRAIFGGTSGVDVDIYYRPAWAPFVRRNTSEVSVALSADHRRALVSCPPWVGQPTEQSYDLILPLR